ncbi:hypothetical protein V6N11_049159 [Hibiscus sabdariffa]|uniref:Uncharacterized protein n=1 Tax=Hibiscus sabdariffa TaxID=183260 RepID=A0ABR1ZL77_9ROSI
MPVEMAEDVTTSIDGAHVEIDSSPKQTRAAAKAAPTQGSLNIRYAAWGLTDDDRVLVVDAVWDLAHQEEEVQHVVAVLDGGDLEAEHGVAVLGGGGALALAVEDGALDLAVEDGDGGLVAEDYACFFFFTGDWCFQFFSLQGASHFGGSCEFIVNFSRPRRSGCLYNYKSYAGSWYGDLAGPDSLVFLWPVLALLSPSSMNPWDVIPFSGNAHIHLDSFLSVFNISCLPGEYYHSSQLPDKGDNFVDGAVIAAAWKGKL